MNRNERLRLLVVAVGPRVTVGLICIFVAVGCAVPDGPRTSTDESATLSMQPWRMVMIVFDRSPDASHLTADIDELREARFTAGTTHRLVVRDSHITEGKITFFEKRRARTLTLPNLQGSDITDPEDLATLLEAVATYFPAENEALFLSGHGRDWRGFGYRTDAPDETLTATTLAGAFTLRDTAPSSQVVVADGSWTATSEWITGLATRDVHVVCAAGEISEEGLDYRTLADPGTPGTADAFARRIAAAVTTEGGEHGVHLAPEHVRSLPVAVRAVSDAGIDHVESMQRQQDLKAQLVDRAVTAGTPGMSWISLGDLEEALKLNRASEPAEQLDEPPSPLNQMLLYLTDVNEHGVPTGHRGDYATNAAPSQLSSEFQTLHWAPDYQQRRGFLYRLWYHRF